MMTDKSYFRSIFDWMPEQVSTWAAQVDFINNFITYVSVFCTLAVSLSMLWMAWKYKRTNNNQMGAYITHDATMETLWTAVPTVVCIFVLVYGLIVFRDTRTPPASAIEINVEGYQWGWNYTYPNGKVAGQDLTVPVGQPVKLILRSRDVNHSFFIPVMRVKEDVINGTYHYMWFNANQTGDFPIFCTAYCGTSHSNMIGRLKVVSQEQYDDYVADRGGNNLTPVELGSKLYSERGCKACHSLDGSKGVGPTWKGVYGQKVEFTDGTDAVRDEAYMRESILYSMKKVVKDYPPVMPNYSEGPTKLDDKQVEALIAYIKSLK